MKRTQDCLDTADLNRLPCSNLVFQSLPRPFRKEHLNVGGFHYSNNHFGPLETNVSSYWSHVPSGKREIIQPMSTARLSLGYSEIISSPLRRPVGSGHQELSSNLQGTHLGYNVGLAIPKPIYGPRPCCISFGYNDGQGVKRTNPNILQYEHSFPLQRKTQVMHEHAQQGQSNGAFNVKQTVSQYYPTRPVEHGRPHILMEPKFNNVYPSPNRPLVAYTSRQPSHTSHNEQLPQKMDYSPPTTLRVYKDTVDNKPNHPVCCFSQEQKYALKVAVNKEVVEPCIYTSAAKKQCVRSLPRDYLETWNFYKDCLVTCPPVHHTLSNNDRLSVHSFNLKDFYSDTCVPDQLVQVSTLQNSRVNQDLIRQPRTPSAFLPVQPLSNCGVIYHLSKEANRNYEKYGMPLKKETSEDFPFVEGASRSNVKSKETRPFCPKVCVEKNDFRNSVGKQDPNKLNCNVVVGNVGKQSNEANHREGVALQTPSSPPMPVISSIFSLAPYQLSKSLDNKDPLVDLNNLRTEAQIPQRDIPLDMNEYKPRTTSPVCPQSGPKKDFRDPRESPVVQINENMKETKYLEKNNIAIVVGSPSDIVDNVHIITGKPTLHNGQIGLICMQNAGGPGVEKSVNPKEISSPKPEPQKTSQHPFPENCSKPSASMAIKHQDVCPSPGISKNSEGTPLSFKDLHWSLCKLISSSVSYADEQELRTWLAKSDMLELQSKNQNISHLLGSPARELWLKGEGTSTTLARVISRLQGYIQNHSSPFPHVIRTGTVFLPMLVVKELLFPQVPGHLIDRVLQEHRIELRPTTLSEETHLKKLHKKAYFSKLRKLVSHKHLLDIYTDMLNLFYYECVRRHLGKLEKQQHEVENTGA